MRYEQRIGIPAKGILKAALAPVGENIIKLWIKLKIPIISFILGDVNKHMPKRSLQIETVNFSVKRKKLFDIVVCSCPDLGNCSCVENVRLGFLKYFGYRDRTNYNSKIHRAFLKYTRS
jgi:hypothetical protein